MIGLKNNFITNSELELLNSKFNKKLGDFNPQSQNFYHWMEIDENEIFEDIFFLRILNRILLFSSNNFKQKLKIHYCGFAYQTEGFDYHADAVWPENEQDRDLGLPSKNINNYKNYQGKWIPNYVPTRKFTTVLYLNDDIEGGETHFPTLNILIKPEKNKIVGFKCDENHIHGVMPTIKGIRKVFICWFE